LFLLSGCATTKDKCGNEVDRFFIQPVKVTYHVDPAGNPVCETEIKTTGINWAGAIGAILAAGASF
jgi:hypothetical protein